MFGTAADFRAILGGNKKALAPVKAIEAKVNFESMVYGFRGYRTECKGERKRKTERIERERE
jgi:hypothetical protein